MHTNKVAQQVFFEEDMMDEMMATVMQMSMVCIYIVYVVLCMLYYICTHLTMHTSLVAGSITYMACMVAMRFGSPTT